MNFHRKQPCDNCPYRKDAPLQLWHPSEFAKLLEEENKQFGKVFGCHKKDGHICVGYLIMQDNNNIPNINLRMILLKRLVDRKYLDSLFCKSPMFTTVKEMVKANFPKLLLKKQK